MLKDRVISTLKFFDLQDYALTLMELHSFLIADKESLWKRLDPEWEIINDALASDKEIRIDEIQKCLDSECRRETENSRGFYSLAGRKELIDRRLQNYLYGIEREKLIKKYIGGLKHVPFVRGAALGGSQAMGLAKSGSDIDLLIITDSRFLWLGRTLATLYFQILGKRRHGNKITNRFCLNHYLAGPKILEQIKNLYSAMEYGRLRPLVRARATAAFQENNAAWIKQIFPNWQPVQKQEEGASSLQKLLEKFFMNAFGNWLEVKLKAWQLPRIKKAKFIIVENDELSFHPDSKQKALLEKFFAAIV